MATARAARSSTGNRRDFNQMERVRLRAARMFEQGTSQAEVAHRLGTSRQNAHRWHRRCSRAAAPPSALPGGPAASPNWTAANAAWLNAPYATAPWRTGSTVTGGPCSGSRWSSSASLACATIPSHVWRILRAMGWTLQRPQRHASERDEEAIARWVGKDWPRIRQQRSPARRLDRVLG
jgi:transposase